MYDDKITSISTSNNKITQTNLKKLVDKYKALTPQQLKKFTESDVGTKFIQPLLKYLGWDVENIDEVREQSRTASGPSDYELLIKNKPKVIVEIKSFTNSLDGRYTSKNNISITFPEQATRYAWHVKSNWAVLTNFKEIRLYSSNTQKPEDGLIFKIDVDDLLSSNEIFLLSKESIVSGNLDSISVKKERVNIDRAILNDLDSIHQQLHDDIIQNNEVDNKNSLRQQIQILMNRLIVIRVAEDRHILTTDVLLKHLQLWLEVDLGTQFSPRLKLLFQEFEQIYDTTLFQKNQIDELKITDKVLTSVIETLYKYNFDLIDADVLGSIYENYLTKNLIEIDQNEFQIIDNSKNRKSVGVYYTPPHLVTFILENTLGKKLKQCTTPEQVSEIKVLDPACGSGSFLIKAFDLFYNWYSEYNERIENENKNKLNLNLVLNSEKKILSENLFGVDVDEQAAEIASVNLMLKALRKKEKLEPILNKNIRIGNSLINGTETKYDELDTLIKEKIKKFDWNLFPVKQFDVVIGNPPYFKIRANNPIRMSTTYSDVQSKTVNIAMMFIRRSLQLLKNDGALGLVIPKMCAYTGGWSTVRNHIFSDLSLTDIIDCKQAFDDVLLEQILLIGNKSNNRTEESLDEIKYNVGTSTTDTIKISAILKQKLAINTDTILLESNEIAYNIRKKLLSTKQTLGDIYGENIKIGMPIQSKNWQTVIKPHNYIPILKGADIFRYYAQYQYFYDADDNRIKDILKKSPSLNNPHIACQRIVAHITKPISHIILMSAYVSEEQPVWGFNTVTNIYADDENKFNLFVILGLLNSRITSYYLHKFVYCNSVRSMDLYPTQIKRVPLPNLEKKQQQNITELVKSHIEHVKKKDRIEPKIENYLIEKTKDTMTLRDYIQTIDSIIVRKKTYMNEQKHNITKCNIIVKNKILKFHVSYHTEKSHQIKQRIILELEIQDDYIREFLIYELRNPNFSKKSGLLYEQIFLLKTRFFGRGYNEHITLVRKMMKRYCEDHIKFKKWKEIFTSTESKIDEIFYESFGLTQEEIQLIEQNSRVKTWNNYT